MGDISSSFLPFEASRHTCIESAKRERKATKLNAFDIYGRDDDEIRNGENDNIRNDMNDNIRNDMNDNKALFHYLGMTDWNLMENLIVEFSV